MLVSDLRTCVLVLLFTFVHTKEYYKMISSAFLLFGLAAAEAALGLEDTPAGAAAVDAALAKTLFRAAVEEAFLKAAREAAAEGEIVEGRTTGLTWFTGR